MAAAMMVSLVACTGDNGENSETPVTSGNDVVEETETNHITLAESWGFENFYTIMTPDVSASNFGITYYLSNFYDVLVEYQDGEYVGGLAEDWTISEDGTVYTFNLRHDVKFSDGSDLTAEDVAKSAFGRFPSIWGNTMEPMAACLQLLKMQWSLMTILLKCI